MKGEPVCGNREEHAALAVLRELIGEAATLSPDATKSAPAAQDDIEALLAAAEVADDAFFDMETVIADMRADIDIIKHVARTEAPVSVDVWVRIHDHLDLALDTLETTWALAHERRQALRDVVKAEQAARKALERAGIEDAQPGSPADIEDAESLWSLMQNISRMVLKRHNEAAPAA